MPNTNDIVSREPATGLEIWRGQPSDIGGCVGAAGAAFPRWAVTALSVRMEVARRFTNELRTASDALARLIASETGKPLWEAFKEVELALARAEAAQRAYGERCAQRKHDSALHGNQAVRHKPLGVMAVIAPFCEPLASALEAIVPALVAGNTVVLKPSERTPATALLLGQIASKSGVPAGVFQVAIGDGSVGLALAVHEGVQGVLFCGSSQTGQTLAKRLAGRPDRLLSLRLGGNNPLVVWDTPALDDAAVLVVQSAFGCAGQRSTAARRLIVRDTLADDLLARVKTLADRIICGAPFDEPAPFMGPVIAPEMADGLTQSFIWLMSNGGHPIKHMQRLKDGLPFISPAIIDVTSMATRPDVELYGPLLQVVRVPDFDAAIAEANATRYGLAAGLIGGTQQDYGQFWARVRAGQIHWNRTTTASLPAAPLGTVGVSGNFRAGGVYMTDACAYPVASAEAESPRAAIGAGFASV